VLDPDLLAAGRRAGDALVRRAHTVAVAEGSCGGLVSAALLAVPGASAYYRGGAVIYTAAAVRSLLGTAVPRPEPLRGASEPFARWLAEEVAADLGTTWGVGEGGATGPSGNPYGDPAGHCWMAVHGPSPRTRHLLTGDDRRTENMVAFATAALTLLAEQVEATPAS